MWNRKNENTQEINQEETSDAIGIKDELIVRLDPDECFVQIEPVLREDDEEAYEEEAATTSHFSSEGKQETAMAPTITEVVIPPKIPNKEEVKTNFAATTETNVWEYYTVMFVKNYIHVILGLTCEIC